MKIFLNVLSESDVAFPLWDATTYGLAPDANCDERPASSRLLALSTNHTPLHHALLTRTREPGFSSPVSALAGENTINRKALSSSQTPYFYLGERDDDDKKGDVLGDLRAIVARMARSHEPKDPDARFAHVYLRPIENLESELRFRLIAFQTTLRRLTHSLDEAEFPASETSWHRLLDAWESWIFGTTMPKRLCLSTNSRIAQARVASFSTVFWGFTAKFLEATVVRETLGRKEWQALAKRLLNLPWLCEASDAKKQDAYFTLIKVLGADTPTHLDLDSLATELDLSETATGRLHEAFFKRVPMETESDVARVTTYLNGLTESEKPKAYQNLQVNPHITPAAKIILAYYVESRYTSVSVGLFISSTPTEN